MNRLYLLGFTNDLKGVVFGRRGDAKKGTFWVPVDDRFLSALDKLERTRGKSIGVQKRKRAAATPKGKDGRPLPPVGRSSAGEGMPASEIQQLLREGRSIKSVADEAKVALAWVERLAEPVQAERLGVVRMAQRAFMPRPRLGPSGLPLGEAVRHSLEERRATPETIESLDDSWDARAARSGGWRVSLRFNHRGKRRVAEWQFHKGKVEIHPRNRLAGQLGWAASDEVTHEEPEEVIDFELESFAEAEAPAPVAKAVRPKAKPKPKPKPKAKTRRTAPARKAKPAAKRKPAKVAPKRKR